MRAFGERLRDHLPTENQLRAYGRAAMSYFQENVLLETPRNHPPEFEKNVHDLMKEGKYWPVILGTHTSHSAGLPLVEEAEDLAEICNPYLGDNQIKGSLLLIANTVEGGQSDEIVGWFKRVEPTLREHHAEPLMVLRKKDAEGLTPEVQREYQRQLIRKLGGVVKAGQIPLVLPEATVESGRQKPGGVPGDIKGMVYLQQDTVAFVTQRILKQKKIPLYFLVGTTGANRIYDPITKEITMFAKATAVMRETRLGKHLVSPIMSSVVDNPLSYTQLEQLYGENGKLSGDVLEWALGELLARLLPYNERGVFAEPELHELEAETGRRDTSDLF